MQVFGMGGRSDYAECGLPVCRLGGILRQLGVDCLRLAAGERDSD